MNKKLTPEERAFLEYNREKTNNNEFHRFYPNDIVMGNKTIDDFEPVNIIEKRFEITNEACLDEAQALLDHSSAQAILARKTQKIKRTGKE